MPRASFAAECRNPACPTVVAEFVARVKAGDDDAEQFIGLAMAAALRHRKLAAIADGDKLGHAAVSHQRESAMEQLSIAYDALDLEREQFESFYIVATREHPAESLETPCPACGEVDEVEAL